MTEAIVLSLIHEAHVSKITQSEPETFPSKLARIQRFIAGFWFAPVCSAIYTIVALRMTSSWRGFLFALLFGLGTKLYLFRTVL